jgi:hypothetical protein
MKGSRVKTSTSSRLPNNNINTSQNINNKSSSLLKNQNINSSLKEEDDFISNLQKQIYYLELEMKLMKDREIETKNKVGGYEVLFRDGVPLNEHFLALKTKYTNEKDQFEKYITDINSEIYQMDQENKFLSSQIDDTNKNYYDIIEKLSQNSEFYQNKIFDFNSKLINENNNKESQLKDKEIYSKMLYRFNSENVHHTRTIEKNKLFKENKEEKNKNTKDRNLEKFDEIDKLTVRSLLEKEQIERKLENNPKGKLIENENSILLMTINKLDRDSHMAKAKIGELENIQILNKKYLLDEEMTKRIYEKENKRLNDELDGLSKLNEENMKQKVKENEKNQSIVIRNSIANNETKMGLLLSKFKEEENLGRELLEEKNAIAQRIALIYEVIENQNVKENETKREIVEVKNAIHELEIMIEDNKNLLGSVTLENERVRLNADKNENDIKVLNKKIEELQQKIELNTILKDIDVNELKMLSQNNALVNNSINTLISKWDKVQTKLHEMEEKK